MSNMQQLDHSLIFPHKPIEKNVTIQQIIIIKEKKIA